MSMGVCISEQLATFLRSILLGAELYVHAVMVVLVMLVMLVVLEMVVLVMVLVVFILQIVFQCKVLN